MHSRNRPTATDEKKTLLYFGCYFSGWYNFGKIVKIVATRCHILKLKCTKFDFGWDSAPDPLAWFKGPTSKGKYGWRRQWEREAGRGTGREAGVRGCYAPKYFGLEPPLNVETVQDYRRLLPTVVESVHTARRDET